MRSAACSSSMVSSSGAKESHPRRDVAKLQDEMTEAQLGELAGGAGVAGQHGGQRRDELQEHRRRGRERVQLRDEHPEQSRGEGQGAGSQVELRELERPRERAREPSLVTQNLDRRPYAKKVH